MPAVVNLTPKITTAQEATGVMSDLIKNPPQNPVQALQFYGKIFDVNGSVSAALGAFLPGAGVAISLISGIFDAFSSAPSIGQITLQAIGQLSSQITQVANQLSDLIKSQTEAAAEKTIEVVLAGADQIAREQSAVMTIENILETSLTDAANSAKDSDLETYLENVKQMRQATLAQINDSVTANQMALDKLFSDTAAQVTSTFSSLILPMYNALNSQLRDLQEQQNAAQEVLQSQIYAPPRAPLLAAAPVYSAPAPRAPIPAPPANLMSQIATPAPSAPMLAAAPVYSVPPPRAPVLAAAPVITDNSAPTITGIISDLSETFSEIFGF